MTPLPETEAALARLPEILFAGPTPLFAVLDGASAPDLLQQLYQNKPEHCCLYRGELAADIASVAPYLVRLESGGKFSELVLNEGWGQHWGIFAASQADLRALRDHFRQFHTVELPDQRPALFRYYDPRVLRSFLPACNAAELAAFFGPVQQFFAEAEKPEMGIKFALAAKALKAEPFEIANSKSE